MTILPGTDVPSLSLPLVAGGTWSLDTSEATKFTIVVYYRGYHCPKCKEQLLDLQEHLAALEATGADVVAISMDPQDRAEKARDESGDYNVSTSPTAFRKLTRARGVCSCRRHAARRRWVWRS